MPTLISIICSHTKGEWLAWTGWTPIPIDVLCGIKFNPNNWTPMVITHANVRQNNGRWYCLLQYFSSVGTTTCRIAAPDLARGKTSTEPIQPPSIHSLPLSDPRYAIVHFVRTLISIWTSQLFFWDYEWWTSANQLQLVGGAKVAGWMDGWTLHPPQLPRHVFNIVAFIVMKNWDVTVIVVSNERRRNNSKMGEIR